MTDNKETKVKVKIIPDSYDIPIVECPRCQCFIPNAVVGDMTCPLCGLKFKVIE